MKISKTIFLAAAFAWNYAVAVVVEGTTHSSSSDSTSKSPDRDLELGLTRTSFDFLKDGDTAHDLLHKVHEAGSDNALCDGSSKSISGYMNVKGSKYDEDGENKHLFFWMFEKRSTEDVAAEEIPFVIWLTGGPGCSSTMALLTENGPCSVNPDGESTSVNPFSWTEVAHVLWLDSPAGVGFSYGEESDSNEAMISEDAYYFLQAFFKTYPEYLRKDPFLYIVGESYGGHYAPAIAHRIWQGNQALLEADNEEDQDKVVLPLGGLAIGNGLTNPGAQYPWYPEMVYNNSHKIKVVDESTYETMKEVVPECSKLIHQCNQGDSELDSFACQTAFVFCNMDLLGPYQRTGLNPYDITKKCEVPPQCYDWSLIKKWLNREETMKALGVDEKQSHRWEPCNFDILKHLDKDWMKDFSPFVLDLLDKAKISVLIYAGDLDYVCNYLGNQAWTLELPWSGQDGFKEATPADWKGAGLARVNPGDKKFTFLQV